MKKKAVSFLLCTVMVFSVLTGCGGTKEIKTTPVSSESTAAQTGNTSDNQNGDLQNVDATTGANGYEFTVNGVSMGPDMDAAYIVSALGDPLNYFEAASCAFEGLDKIYTYASFEIDTYPQDGKDLISAVILKDDLVYTEEGAYIGMTVDQITALYGETEADGGALVYQQGDMKLKFIIDNQVVVSIEYDSKVLDLE